MSETIRNALRENYGLVDIESEDKILALFPSWRTFSNDCKPEEGKEFIIKLPTGNIAVGNGNDNAIEGYIIVGWQWYPIPNE